MKFVFSIILFFYALPFVSSQVTSDFIAKWHLEAFVYNEMKIEPSDKQKQDYFHFMEEGIVEIKDEEGAETGNWEWIKDDKKIRIFEEGDEESFYFEVLEVSKDRLIVLVKEGDDEIKVHYIKSQK